MGRDSDPALHPSRFSQKGEHRFANPTEVCEKFAKNDENALESAGVSSLSSLGITAVWDRVLLESQTFTLSLWEH